MTWKLNYRDRLFELVKELELTLSPNLLSIKRGIIFYLSKLKENEKVIYTCILFFKGSLVVKLNHLQPIIFIKGDSK